MLFLNGRAIPSRGARGEAVVDNTFLLLFNAHYEPLPFTLPEASFGARWQRVIDTADPELATPSSAVDARGDLTMESRSMMVLQLVETCT
jgi:glycogen operon protein